MSDQSEPSASRPGKNAKVRWKAEDAKVSYANVASINAGSAEIVLNFGVNHSWNPDTNELAIQLNSRVIMNPVTARRFADALQKALAEHDARAASLQPGTDTRQ